MFKFIPKNYTVFFNSFQFSLQFLKKNNIAVNSRLTNVRYLKRNPQRNWGWDINYDNDYSIGILNENPL